MSEKKETKKRISKVSIGIIVSLTALLIITNAWQYLSFSNDKNNLQSQIADLDAIINLEMSTLWVNHETVSQPANSYTSWAKTASYAGYVSVDVESSTTSNTYACVIYMSLIPHPPAMYDVTMTVGSSGTAVFPVLPATTVTVYVGNTNVAGDATETVTVIYYY